MRPTAPVALILTIGLVAAACGGDEATPEPADETTAAPAATAASEEPADETTAAPATATEVPAEDATKAPAEPTPELEPEFAKRAEQSSDGDPQATFGLAGGMWRMLWESEDCERVEMVVSQVDGDFSGGKSSKSSTGTSIVPGVPEGTFTLEQLDPACAGWTLKMTWMS